MTVGNIIEKRATGTGPFPPAEGKLGVISARYRRSVRPSKATVSGGTIASAIGSNVRYAGAHEFGFKGTVSVPAHRAKNAFLDILEAGGHQVARWESYGIRGKKKKIASGFVQVKAHQMRMNMPERAPIRRGIEDRLPLYGPALGKAIVDALNPEATA